MTNLVERLRKKPRGDACKNPSCVCVPGDCLCDGEDMIEAADEIDRLRKALSFFFEMNDNGVGLKYTHIEAQRLAVAELTREKE